MALIAMAVYSTDENQKDGCLLRTLNSLSKTVDLNRHRIILSINAETYITTSILYSFRDIISHVIRNEGNIGTARAINKIWELRRPDEHVVKMDDDVVINYDGWADELEDAIKADPLIGQIGLKRKDCWEYPEHREADFRSELKMLPHVPGERWRVVEKVKHVIGTCVMHSAALIDKVGYLYQPSLYGYDDVIMSHRSRLAGFYSCFLPHIDIDHIDEGQTPYQGWKEKHSGEVTKKVITLVNQMERGETGLYFDINGNQIHV